MKALVFDGSSPCLALDRAQPTRAPAEALLSLRLAGICNTDLEIARGYMGFRGVLGHEFVADVLAADDPRWIGRRVVGRINCGCGSCAECQRGLENHCATRTVLGIVGRDGVFAERFLLPERNLVAVPDGVSDEAAVFAEPLAAALRILQQVPEIPQRALVVGDGKLGCLIALALADRGVDVTLAGRHPARVAFTRSTVPGTIEECTTDTVCRREKFELVVEASGSAAGLAFGLSRTRPLGSLVLKTTCHGPHALSLAPVVIDEIRIVGSRCGPIEAALETLRNGRIAVESLIRERYPLAAAEQALARAGESGMLKVLIEGVPSP